VQLTEIWIDCRTRVVGEGSQPAQEGNVLRRCRETGRPCITSLLLIAQCGELVLMSVSRVREEIEALAILQGLIGFYLVYW
jgi:hypothetical protein